MVNYNDRIHFLCRAVYFSFINPLNQFVRLPVMSIYTQFIIIYRHVCGLRGSKESLKYGIIYNVINCIRLCYYWIDIGSMAMSL